MTATIANWNNPRTWSFETAEAKAEREARELAEHQVRMEAHRKAEMEKRIARELPIYRGITNALQRKTAAGEVTLDETTLTLTVKGTNASWRLSIDTEYERGSRWSARPTGKLRVVVGDFGDRTSYPQRKDGTHNYDAIADKLLAHANAVLARQSAEQVKRTNTVIAERLVQELGLPAYGSGVTIEATTNPAAPIAFKFSTSGAISVERATALVAALRAAGLVAAKKE